MSHTGYNFTVNTAGYSISPVVSMEPVKLLFLEIVLDGKEGQEMNLLASLLLLDLAGQSPQHVQLVLQR